MIKNLGDFKNCNIILSNNSVQICTKLQNFTFKGSVMPIKTFREIIYAICENRTLGTRTIINIYGIDNKTVYNKYIEEILDVFNNFQMIVLNIYTNGEFLKYNKELFKYQIPYNIVYQSNNINMLLKYMVYLNPNHKVQVKYLIDTENKNYLYDNFFLLSEKPFVQNVEFLIDRNATFIDNEFVIAVKQLEFICDKLTEDNTMYKISMFKNLLDTSLKLMIKNHLEQKEESDNKELQFSDIVKLYCGNEYNPIITIEQDGTAYGCVGNEPIGNIFTDELSTKKICNNCKHISDSRNCHGCELNEICTGQCDSCELVTIKGEELMMSTATTTTCYWQLLWYRLTMKLLESISKERIYLLKIIIQNNLPTSYNFKG